MIHVPLITPFGPTGQVDTESLEALAHRVLDDGATGLVALGTTAEAAALDDGERAAVTETVGRVCRARGARFTVGVGSGATGRTARELAALAALPSLPDAALVTVPSFTRPGEQGVIAHFRELAAASPVPLTVYHVSFRTGQPLGTAALRALAAIPGVTGMKYSTGAVDAEIVALLGDRPAGFEVLGGDDVFAPALLALGADGAVLASAHLATARWAELAATGDRELGHRLSALGAALFREPNPTVIKAVLHARGLIPTPYVRLPLLPAGAAARDAALDLLTALEQPRTAPARTAGAAAPAASPAEPRPAAAHLAS
ncbi:dihydrodipicolinate synthase family protein [Actinacidiphila rubida]|nr:dihydrodipicolinate synthase family protein [Actinacidiphila rubida]